MGEFVRITAGMVVGGNVGIEVRIVVVVGKVDFTVVVVEVPVEVVVGRVVVLVLLSVVVVCRVVVSSKS